MHAIITNRPLNDPAMIIGMIHRSGIIDATFLVAFVTDGKAIIVACPTIYPAVWPPNFLLGAG
jgi:hypothetical protein